MKKLFFLTFLFTLIFGKEENKIKKFEVNLNFKKITLNKKKKNLIHLNIITNKKTYLKSSKDKKAVTKNAFYSKSFWITNHQHQLTISLPKGNYVITCFNDTNNNKKFDMFFGMPKEQFGFANYNDKILLAQPKFKDLLLEVKSKTNYTIKLYN